MSANTTHTYVGSGTYIAEVNVTFPDGMEASFEMTVIVTENGPLAALVEASVPGQCGYWFGNVTFRGFAGGGNAPYTYGWDFGDGNTSVGPSSPSHAYVPPMRYYTAELTLTDASGDIATSVVTFPFWQYPPPPCPPPPFLVVTPIANPPSGSAPLAVSFWANLSPGFFPPVVFRWDFGDGSSSSDRDPSHTFAVPGAYNVTLTVSDALLRSSVRVLTVVVLPDESGTYAVPYAIHAATVVGVVVAALVVVTFYWKRFPRP